MLTVEKKVQSFDSVLLQNGIDRFTEKSGWSQDLHTDFYCERACAQKSGASLDGDALWKKLHEWSALRGGVRGMRERWECKFGDMKCEYRKILRLKYPNIESCKWDSVKGLFHVAHGIKGVQSSVFASKLCHFILPSVFTVVDIEVMRLYLNAEQYGQYWKFCQKRWQECDQDALKGMLKAEILRHDKKADFSGYPWATKIAELCVMGRKK